MLLSRLNFLIVYTISLALYSLKSDGQLHKISPTISPLQHFNSKFVANDPLNEDIKNAANLEAHELVMLNPDAMHNSSSISELARRSLQVRIYHAVYNDLLIQRYDSFSELRHSGGPHVNQELCLQQLAHLNHRHDLQLSQKYRSQDINLAQLLNTFGRPSPSFYLGDGFWPGAYEECLRLQVETVQGNAPTRYCVAHLQLKSWTQQSSPLDRLTAMKSGVCLPRSCDSVRYKNKYELIMRLLESNMRDIDRNETELVDLYCLPDSQSSLRTWWLQPKPVIALLCLISWIALQVYATLRRDTSEVYRSLSITNSLSILVGSRSESKSESSGKQDGEQQNLAPKAEATPLKLVEFSGVEAIKVLAQVFIICGHVLMCLPHNINNGRELSRNASIVLKLNYIMPAYSVNAFFGLSGMLTSYLMFRQNVLSLLIKRPAIWIGAVVQRYLRIMPLYIVVVVYAKYLAKFVGSGPFWDYGTSGLAHRRICEQESWLWTLLFAANFKSPLRHCIPSAWYLANDFQFFLITPILLAALNWHPKFGKWALRALVIVSSIVCFLNTFNSHLDDIRPIANFMPHGFKLYITYMHQSYTRPENRICAYLSGIILGYSLYAFERDRNDIESGKMGCNEEQQRDSKNWMEYMKKWGMKLTLFFFIVIFVFSPIMGYTVKFNKWWARFIASLMATRGHVNVALAACYYVIVASFGFGNPTFDKLMSASFWKPLARLSLCVLLVNIEVIIYITQIKTHIMYLAAVSYASIAIICVLGCYLTAAVLFVFFEAPMKTAIDLLLKMVSKNKKKCA